MDTPKNTAHRFPVLFLGHGSPMNALADNEFTRTLTALGTKLPRPKAVLMVSAHWMTKGTAVTHMARPRTIHDFYGFPKELFAVQYPAPGAPALADRVRALVREPAILADDEAWGLDHGAWAVLKFLYPQADVPVVQLSLDMTKAPELHFALGEKLRPLRDEGVLILGSGNIVHNLRTLDWDENAQPFPWATEFDAWVKERAEARDFQALVRDFARTEAGRLSVPTLDHYLPLLYVLGAADPSEPVRSAYAAMQNASISMRCIQFG